MAHVWGPRLFHSDSILSNDICGGTFPKYHILRFWGGHAFCPFVLTVVSCDSSTFRRSVLWASFGGCEDGSFPLRSLHRSCVRRVQGGRAILVVGCTRQALPPHPSSMRPPVPSETSTMTGKVRTIWALPEASLQKLERHNPYSSKRVNLFQNCGFVCSKVSCDSSEPMSPFSLGQPSHGDCARPPAATCSALRPAAVGVPAALASPLQVQGLC